MAPVAAVGNTWARVVANGLFVAGLGLLWSAGFAGSPIRAVGEGPFRSCVLLLPGLIVAALGVAEGLRHREWNTPALLTATSCLVAVLAAAQSCGEGTASIAAVTDRLLDGMLFFVAIALTVRYRAIVSDMAVPLGFLAGSLLAWASSVLGFVLPYGASINGVFVAFVLCFYGIVRWGACDQGWGGERAPQLLPSRRWVILRYGALVTGAAAAAFVFGVMTDLYGWMSSVEAVLATQIANMVAAGVLAVIFGLYRRPFSVDGALTVVLPLFAAALISLPAEPAGLSFSRLAIMVGYLLLFIIGWVLIKRERRLHGSAGTVVLAVTVGLLLSLVQVGRFTAAALLGLGGLTPETLSAIALVLFWLVALVAAGAYWLARTRAVERDLSMLEDPEATEEEPALPEVAEGGDSKAGDRGIDGSGRRDKGLGVVYVDRLSAQAERLAAQIGLSARELEVLEEFARGRSAASIAEKFFISPNTVKTHLRRIYEKAGIHSRRELLDMMEEAERGV